MPAVIGVIVAILAVIGVLVYLQFFKPIPQIDTKTISPVRLEDPDGPSRLPKG